MRSSVCIATRPSTRSRSGWGRTSFASPRTSSSPRSGAQKRWNLLLPRLHASTRQSAPPADVPLLTDEIQRQVTAALERLPVKYRAPLVLFEIEEWSYDEIAKSAGHPLRNREVAHLARAGSDAAAPRALAGLGGETVMNETRAAAAGCAVLPRAKASPAFTSDVMRNIRRETRTAESAACRSSGAWPRRFAMAVCIVARRAASPSLQHDRRERMAALRAEQQKIEAELQAVKEIASDAEPMVVLENEQGTRVIMDLDSAIQPASLRTYD